MRDLLLRLDRWPRRIAAVLLLAMAGLLAAAGQKPPAAPVASAGARPVVTAVRDLPAGAVISDTDVAVREDDFAPPTAFGSVAAVVGRRAAGPIGRGEPVTATRVLGAGLGTGLGPGELAVPVPVSNSSASLVRAGDTVELIAAPATDEAQPEVVVRSTRVLAAVPAEGDAAGSAADPSAGQLVVAVDEAAAIRLAAASSHPVLAAVIGDP